MYAVLGEGQSDADVLKVLIRRLADNERMPVLARGFNGGPSLLRDGVKAIRALITQGARRFVICHDADGPETTPIERKLRETIVTKLPGGIVTCIVVPVQEIEAWFMADPACFTTIITGFEPPVVGQPERVATPKEHLVRAAKRTGKRYEPPLHNEALARHLDLATLERRCPSFKPLADFVRRDRSTTQ